MALIEPAPAMKFRNIGAYSRSLRQVNSYNYDGETFIYPIYVLPKSRYAVVYCDYIGDYSGDDVAFVIDKKTRVIRMANFGSCSCYGYAPYEGLEDTESTYSSSVSAWEASRAFATIGDLAEWLTVELDENGVAVAATMPYEHYFGHLDGASRLAVDAYNKIALWFVENPVTQ